MEEKILALRAEEKTYKQIVVLLGCAQSTVSYHCGAGQKVKSADRHKAFRSYTCSCGGYKSKWSIVYHKCRSKNTRNKVNNVMIKGVFHKQKSQKKYDYIRRLAREFPATTKTEKKCKMCGFRSGSKCMPHKRNLPFNDTALTGEVNDLDNLVYLCSNHHVMLDRGLTEF